MTTRTNETIAQHPAESLLRLIESTVLSDYCSYFDNSINMRIVDDGAVGNWRAWLGVSSEGLAPGHQDSDIGAVHLAHITIEKPGDVSRADYYEVQDGDRVFWQPIRRPGTETEAPRYLSVDEINAVYADLHGG